MDIGSWFSILGIMNVTYLYGQKKEKEKKITDEPDWIGIGHLVYIPLLLNINNWLRYFFVGELIHLSGLIDNIEIVSDKK